MPSLETSRALFGATRWPPLEAARHLAAWSLMAASAALTRVAVRLVPPPIRQSQGAAHLEFHVDSAAADGGLYLDGVWVAWLPGVTRL